jgi:hypothetical protein
MNAVYGSSKNVDLNKDYLRVVNHKSPSKNNAGKDALILI